MLKGPIMAVIMLSMIAPALAGDVKPMNKTSTEQSAEQNAAEIVVRRYMDLLHSGDIEHIMDLYDENAVFLPEGGTTMVGKDKIRESYVALFKLISIPDGESTLEEATIHGDIAVVRLATKATTQILADQQKIPLNSRELFILNKVGGDYKISRYMFNTLK
ncbi:nuclear transport factor 2 family protein [Klebsiella sp. T2.Ur]|nr:nuclear transport factor 2 family protein [Klebsiella sp. T2.Ur]